MKKTLLALTIFITVLTQFLGAALAVERYEILMPGDRDQYVKQLQEFLIDKGYMKGSATGYYGTNTTEAVIKFQQRYGLKADGKAGPETRKAILGKYYKPIPSTRKVSNANSSEEVDLDILRPGDEGEAVKNLQKRLKELGYYTYSKITSYYGPVTEKAVLLFQKQNGLTQNGILDKKTSTLLYSSKAKQYKSTNTSPAVLVQTTGAVLVQEENKQTATAAAKCEKLIEIAKKYLGLPYRTAAEGPNSFDCSGFVYFVLRQMGISPPRSSISLSQVETWAKIESIASLKPGDLVFFSSITSPSRIGHVGIYLGNGNFIHSSSGKGVIISTLSTGHYLGRFRWGRRIWS